MSIIAYARVSTTQQDLANQLSELQEHGFDKLFAEKVSGSNIDNRDEFKRLMAYVREGDTVIATKLDRIARSSRDLMNIVHQLEEKKVTLKIINQGIDSGSTVGKMMLGMLGIISQFERELILERTMEGQRRARAEGRKSGPKPKLSQDEIAQLVKLFDGNEMSKTAIGKQFGITRASVYRIYNENSKC